MESVGPLSDGEISLDNVHDGDVDGRDRLSVDDASPESVADIDNDRVGGGNRVFDSVKEGVRLDNVRDESTDAEATDRLRVAELSAVMERVAVGPLMDKVRERSLDDVVDGVADARDDVNDVSNVPRDKVRLRYEADTSADEVPVLVGFSTGVLDTVGAVTVGDGVGQLRL